MKKRIFACTVAIGLLSFTACGNSKQTNRNIIESTIPTVTDEIVQAEQDEKTETQNTHLNMDIVNNVVVNADIENNAISQCPLYKTLAKEFSKDKAEEILLENDNITNEENNEHTGNVILTTENGAQLMLGPGMINYTSNNTMWDMYGLIQSTYESEFSSKTKMKDEIDTSACHEIENNVRKKLEIIYDVESDESLQLISCISVDINSLTENQNNNEALEEDIKSGHSNAIKSQNGDLYYFNYTIERNGILYLSCNEPQIEKQDDNAITQKTSIQVIVNNGKIDFLYITGAFAVEKISDEDIMTAESGKKFLENKYGTIIVTENYLVDRVWLEYIFVHNPKSNDLYEGTLEPYWCYQVKATDSEGNFYYKADRMNAINGEDFEYE